MERVSKTYDFALLFAALADRTRLRLLNLMDGREVCVCYFVEILGRREGKWMHYKIVTPTHAGAASILREVLSVLRQDAEMQHDLALLNKACCASPQLTTLRGAPAPVKRPALTNASN